MTDACRPVRGAKALEMTMRDVLDGMEELAAEFAYGPCGPSGLRILSVEPPLPAPPPAAAPPTPSRGDVVAFIERRERRACA